MFRGFRSLVLWLIVTAAVGSTIWCLRGELAPPDAPTDPAALLTCGAALALGCCGLWFWGVTTVVVVEVLRDRPGAGPAFKGCPAGVRRVLLAGCGVALVGGLAAPVQASDQPIGSRPAVSLSGLALPERAVTPTRPTAPGPAAPATGLSATKPVASTAIAARPPAPTDLVVAPGDTLWGLAATALPAGSDDARIARLCAAIHLANRAVIGADPDLIRPGQRLVLPSQ